MNKITVGMLVSFAVFYMILAIANLYNRYSIWWVAFDITMVVFMLFSAWLVRELDKEEPDSVNDIFWKRHINGGSVLWLHAFKIVKVLELSRCDYCGKFIYPWQQPIVHLPATNIGISKEWTTHEGDCVTAVIAWGSAEPGGINV